MLPMPQNVFAQRMAPQGGMPQFGGNPPMAQPLGGPPQFPGYPGMAPQGGPQYPAGLTPPELQPQLPGASPRMAGPMQMQPQPGWDAGPQNYLRARMQM